MLGETELGDVRGGGQGNLALSSDHVELRGECLCFSPSSGCCENVFSRVPGVAVVATCLAEWWPPQVNCAFRADSSQKSCFFPLREEGERRPRRTKYAGSPPGSTGSSRHGFLQLAAVQTRRKEKLLFSYKISKSIRKHRIKGSSPGACRVPLNH